MKIFFLIEKHIMFIIEKHIVFNEPNPFDLKKNNDDYFVDAKKRKKWMTCRSIMHSKRYPRIR